MQSDRRPAADKAARETDVPAGEPAARTGPVPGNWNRRQRLPGEAGRTRDRFGVAGTVVVIEPASAGLSLVETARVMDRDVVLLASARADRDACARAERCGARVVDVDTNDPDAVVAAVRELAETRQVEAVVPGMEYTVEAAAACTEALGLPGLPPAVVRRLRNKYEVRRTLAEAGIRVPAFTLVDGVHDLERAVAVTGFPAVLKPVDASGSLAVKRVDSLDDLQALVAGHQRDGLRDVGRELGSAWMLESYLDGPEYSVEGVITDEGPRVVAVTRTLLGPEPEFAELGYIVGDTLPAADRASVAAYVEQVLSALSYPLGGFNAEVRATAGGPVLIEVNPRLAGDRIVRLVELAHGFSLPQAVLRAYVEGPPSAADCCPAPESFAGVRFITAGEVQRAPDGVAIDALRRAPGVDELEFHGKPGKGCCATYRKRVGHVVCTAPTAALLEDRLTHAAAVLAGTRDSAGQRAAGSRKPACGCA